MLTRKMKIVSCSDVDFVANKVNQYNYAYHLLHKMVDESSDVDFINRFKERFGMVDIEYRSLVCEVKAKKNAMESSNKNKQSQIEYYEECLLEKHNPTNRDKYRLFNKIQYLKRSMSNEAVFGGRYLLQKITRECNKGELKDNERLSRLRSEYKEMRTNKPCFIVGEANTKGNRFFDFTDIPNGKLIYKPYKGKQIDIIFKLPLKYRNEFISLSEMANNKNISISVSFNNDYVYFTYDEEKLNGYSVDEISRRLDVKYIKQQHHPKEIEKQLIKDIYKKYYDEQREHKLEGKLGKQMHIC